MLYVKNSTGTSTLIPDYTKQISEIENSITFGPWNNLTSKIGLTCQYRTCKRFTQVAIYGNIENASFQANTGYSFGTLPTNARAPFANWYQLVDSRLYINISGPEGNIDINAWTACSGVRSKIHFLTTIAI